MASHVSIDFKASDYWHPRFWPMWVTLGILRTAALFPYPVQISLGTLLGKVLQTLISAGSRIAQSSGGAMLPFYPERKKDGSGYIIWIEPPLEDFPTGDDVQDATIVNASIEKFVRQNPEQYLWIHKRFKTRPPGEPAIYP